MKKICEKRKKLQEMELCPLSAHPHEGVFYDPDKDIMGDLDIRPKKVDGNTFYGNRSRMKENTTKRLIYSHKISHKWPKFIFFAVDFGKTSKFSQNYCPIKAKCRNLPSYFGYFCDWINEPVNGYIL
jgi:hypothetical protein